MWGMASPRSAGAASGGVMPLRAWTLRECVSRLLAGAATGCGALVAVDLLVLIPIWGPQLLKGDERWETVFFVAVFGLPAAIAAGGLAGLILRRSRAIRLSRVELFACCLGVALVAQLLRPAVSRVRLRGVRPLYEVVPDTLAVFFCVVAVAVTVWRLGPRSPAIDAEPALGRVDLGRDTPSH